MAAEHASITRIECSGWASLAPAGHVAPPDSARRYIGSTRVGGPDGREEVPDPYGRSGISVVVSELPFLGDKWRLWTRPRAGSGSGAVGPVR